MPVRCGGVSESDLPSYLEFDARRIGCEYVGKPTALRIWRDLLRHPGLNAISLVRNGDRHETVGFGAACIVSTKFTDAELGDPRPGTNARFIGTPWFSGEHPAPPDSIPAAASRPSV